MFAPRGDSTPLGATIVAVELLASVLVLLLLPPGLLVGFVAFSPAFSAAAAAAAASILSARASAPFGFPRGRRSFPGMLDAFLIEVVLGPLDGLPKFRHLPLHMLRQIRETIVGGIIACTSAVVHAVRDVARPPVLPLRCIPHYCLQGVLANPDRVCEMVRR